MVTVPNRIELLTLLPKHAVVAEIGVDEGRFSDQIRLITRPKELHLIDCWEQQDRQIYKDGTNQTTEIQEKKWHDVVEKFKSYPEVKVHRTYSIPASQSFPDGYFDWLYLDANHGYEAVAQDLQAWWSKIKLGGLFLGHDWVSPEQRQSIGVIKAATEFMSSYGLSLEYMTTDTGSYAFRSWGIRRS